MRYLVFMLLMNLAYAQQGTVDYGYLKKEDQKYFKNESGDGNNQMERIDMNVKEINKLHGEVASLKQQLAKLREEVEKLKKK